MNTRRSREGQNKSDEAVMRYVKDFSRTLVLTEEGYGDQELRIITGLSEKTIGEYEELIKTYSTEEYQERLYHLHSIFGKKETNKKNEETTLRTESGRWNK
jgi:hypothetical protein